MSAVDLYQHLELYGIRHFDSDSYWQWGAGLLGFRLAKELNKLRRPLQGDSASQKQLDRFYDFIAQEKVASVVHSMKAGAICASGEAIENAITSAHRVFDVGCSIGYLSSYFARVDRSKDILGWDRSSLTIRKAQELAEKLKVKNVRFAVGDIEAARPEEKFDAIVSCQTLGGLRQRLAAFTNIAACLAPDGRVVCIEAFGRSNEARDFLTDAFATGLRLYQFNFIYFSDLGKPSAYPCFVLKKAATAVEIDFDSEYSIALRRIAQD